MARPRGVWSDKAWRDAVRKAVHKQIDGKGPKKLELLADKLTDAGLAGDVSAIREIGDRLDGKPKQIIDAVINDERMVVEGPEVADTTDAWATGLKH